MVGGTLNYLDPAFQLLGHIDLEGYGLQLREEIPISKGTYSFIEF